MPSQTYVIYDPSGPDIELHGEMLADEQGADIGTVKVYRTGSGKIVAEQRRTPGRERSAIDRVGVFETIEDLSGWLGYSPGAKAVLEKLGHPIRRRIE